MIEPTAIRDNGPYRSADQARAQIDATLHGIPEAHTAPGFAGELILMNALLMTGVQISSWEDVQRQSILAAVPTEAVQVIAGWIVRAFLLGATQAVEAEVINDPPRSEPPPPAPDERRRRP